jgi:hypothetical protein
MKSLGKALRPNTAGAVARYRCSLRRLLFLNVEFDEEQPENKVASNKLVTAISTPCTID